MNVNKKLLKTKSSKISLLMIFVMFLLVCGYFIYENNRENEIIKNMIITFTDVKEVEYGTKDFDVRKELVKEVKDAELTNVPEIDTMKLGKATLKFTLTKSDVTKEVEHKISVVDTKGPEITLEADSKDLIVGDEYDIKTNVKSVTDVVDGDIALVEDAKTINEKASEEYSKLKKEDITNETKITDKKLNDFFIEKTKDEDDKEVAKLYLKNCYYIDGSVDTSKANENKISIVAVDRNGLKTIKEFTVTVKEKKAEKAVASSNSNGGASSGNGSSSGGSSYVGSKSDIVNLALAQVGKPYIKNTAGPDSFDCSGLIYYAYTQNGWSIPRYPESSGTRITFEQLQPGDIVYMPSQNHVFLYIGNNQIVEAKNPSTGVGTGEFVRFQNISYQYIRY